MALISDMKLHTEVLTMFPKESYRLLRQLTSSLHGAQAKTLVAMTVGLLHCGQMRSFSIAQQLADRCQVKLKSALQRFYRFVHNHRFDDLAVWGELAHQLLSSAGKPAVIAVDWTEWHSGLRVLAATACVGRRAVPIYVQAFSKTEMLRSQNSRENAFLSLLSALSPMIRRAVLIFDRGFRRVSFIRELQLLDHQFIVRLTAKVTVSGDHYEGLLSRHPLRPGRSVDLGLCRLRGDRAVTVRVVGIWAKGQSEPWWLAVNFQKTPGRIAEIYDRRMSIEEAFRDSKGCRFGIKIKWTRFQTCEAINRLFLLAALALTVWTLAGLLACQIDPTLRLVCKSKGARRSLLSIGIEATACIRKALAMSWRGLRRLWPPAETRSFAWE